MCKQYVHLDDGINEEGLQRLWLNHVYEEQLTFGTIKDQISSDIVIAGESNCSVSLPEEVC